MERLLRVEEAAAYLATTAKTLYARAHRREIPTVKLGRSLRFRLSDLEKLIKAGLRPALRPLREAVPEESGNISKAGGQ